MAKIPTSGIVVAGAVAAMFMTACGGDEGDVDSTSNRTDAVRCYGINDCAGHGECSGPSGENACEGNNSCAGQGWVSVDTEAACTSEGGTVLEEA